MTDGADDKTELLYDELEVGREFRAMRFEVSQELVNDYIRISGDNNRLYREPVLKTGDGPGRPLTPPGLWGVWGRQAYLQDHKMPGGGVLAGEDLLFVKPVAVGETLTVQARVVDRYVRKDRPNVVFEVSATDSRGELCGTVRIRAIWPS